MDNSFRDEMIQAKFDGLYKGRFIEERPRPCPYCGKDLMKVKNVELHLDGCLEKKAQTEWKRRPYKVVEKLARLKFNRRMNGG